MFACFRAKSSAPEGPADSWSKAEVKCWLKHQGLQYSSATAVDGKKLLSTQPSEWESALGAKSQVLVKAIAELKFSQGLVEPEQTTEPTSEPVAAPEQVKLNPRAALAATAGPPATSEDPYGTDKLELTDRVTGDSDVGYVNSLQLSGQQDGRERLAEQPHGADVVAAVDAGPDLGAVRKVFEAFASFGFPERQTEMDSTKLMKLARECGLLDSKLTSVDVDLFFIKAKPTKRRITFEQFLDVITACSEKKGVESRQLLQAILTKVGPELHGAKAESVRLYDDKSTYTGVAKRGGPTTVDEAHDLATMLDRGSRRSTGNKHPSAPKPPTGAGPGSFASNSAFSKSCVMSVRRQTLSSGGAASLQGDAPDLQSMFESFAAFGAGKQAFTGEMDRSRFAKLCRDCALMDSTTADIVFSQHKKASNKIGFLEFKACLEQVSRDKGLALQQLEDSILTSGGPMINTACI